MKKRVIFVLFMFCILGFMFAQSITVTSPGSGDTWHKGSPYTITWTKTGTQHASVKIRLYDSTGTTKILNITNNTANDGSFGPWTVPVSVSNGNYVVRVKTLDNEVYDDSVVFTLSGALPTADLQMANDPNKKVVKQITDIRKSNIMDKIRPRITSINRLGSPGSPVYIKGRNLGTGQGTKEVYMAGVSHFNNYLLTVDIWQNTYIHGRVKNNVRHGLYNVSTRSRDGKLLSNKVKFTVRSKRQISSITPDKGPKGTRFTLNGPDFGVKPAGNLTFQMITGRTGYPFKLVSWGRTRIVGEVSSPYTSQGVYEVVVQHPNHIDYTTRVRFRVIPLITHTIPDEGPFRAGSKIIIYGKSFMKEQGNQKVYIKGPVSSQSCTVFVTLWSDKIIGGTINKSLPPGTYRIMILNGNIAFSQGVPIVFTGN